jgi:hypothetical protein
MGKAQFGSLKIDTAIKKIFLVAYLFVTGA